MTACKRFTSGRSALGYLLAFSVVAATSALSGCQQQSLQSSETSNNARDLHGKLAPLSIPDDRWTRVTLPHYDPQEATADEQASDIWQRLREGFHLIDDAKNNPRIDQQRLWYASRTQSIERIAERSSPYLYYIIDTLEARQMPLEIALLPIIESAYNPHAYSPSDAAGLWQFIPSTARNFKLKQTRWYDGRRDITASTLAAVKYLEYLHNMFDGDWLHALAAYNAGEGTVSRAIKRNQALGLPTDYWNLQLPKQTQAYIPKLLAIAQLMASPDAYALQLPDIANEPYFAAVPLQHQLELTHIAQLAKVPAEELQALNPAYKQGLTVDGPQHVLVPTEHAIDLAQRLKTLKPADMPQTHRYTVRSGDSLSVIAQRHGTTVSALRQLNRLNSNQLKIGQVLSVAGKSPASNIPPAQATASSGQPAQNMRQYSVRSGDSLSTIAARNGISVKLLRHTNNLRSDRLRIGQALRIPVPATHYTVRKGDSLASIAKRYKVSVQQLQQWNPTQTKLLKPGQTLALHL